MYFFSPFIHIFIFYILYLLLDTFLYDVPGFWNAFVLLYSLKIQLCPSSSFLLEAFPDLLGVQKLVCRVKSHNVVSATCLVFITLLVLFSCLYLSNSRVSSSRAKVSYTALYIQQYVAQNFAQNGYL